MKITLGLDDCLVVTSSTAKPKETISIRVSKIDPAVNRVVLDIDPGLSWTAEYSDDERDVSLRGLQWTYGEGEEFKIAVDPDKWKPQHVMIISLRSVNFEQDIAELMFINKPESYLIVRKPKKAKR